VGAPEELPVDLRIIAATNRNLIIETREGRFREDLYYRLRVVTIELPPLRERRADLPHLISHFTEKVGAELGRPNMGLTPEARAALLGHSWPGNVRELENAIQRGVALARGNDIDVESLPPELGGRPAEAPEALPSTVGETGIDLDAVLSTYERQLLESAIARTGGVKKEAARLLGISFRSIRYRLAKLGMASPEDLEGGE
jgi:two-component system response regulator PilR (NtrC family)